MRWDLRVLIAECETAIGQSLSYRDIQDGCGVSKSTISKIMRGESKSADFEVTSKLLDYFSVLSGRPLDLTDILHYEPDADRKRKHTASKKQALIN